MDKKTKILWQSDSPKIPHIGQSCVTRNCLSKLQGMGYEVEALGYLDSKCKEPVQVPYNVIDCNRTDFLDVNKVADFIRKSNPDVYVVSHDPWHLPCVGYLKNMFPNVRFLGYVTIDGDPVYYGWRNIIKGFHKIVSPTQYGIDVIKQRWADVECEKAPYGVDSETFHFPRQGKPQLREDILRANMGLGEYADIRNKFVGLYVGANQDRKNLGLIHEAWREFEKGKEDKVVLMMFVHSAAMDQEVGAYDLVCFVQDTTTIRVINIPQPKSAIGMFTAASDVLVHPSAGEGFGLTVIESMACGTVPIVLPFAGVTEFCNDKNSYPVPFIRHVGGYHVNRALSTVGNMVEALEFSYANLEDRIARARNGLETVKTYTWDNCALALHNSIQSVLKMPSNGIYFSKVC